MFSSLPRVLFVSQNPELIQAVQAWSAQRQYRCACARNLAEAAEMLRDLRFLEADFDALVVDASLDRRIDYSFLEDVRAEWPELPIGLIFDLRTRIIHDWAEQLGVSIFARPFRARDLQLLLARAGYKIA